MTIHNRTKKNQSVSIPIELIELIEEIVDSENTEYHSKRSFIVDSIEIHINDIKKRNDAK